MKGSILGFIRDAILTVYFPSIMHLLLIFLGLLHKVKMIAP